MYIYERTAGLRPEQQQTGWGCCLAAEMSGPAQEVRMSMALSLTIIIIALVLF